MNKNSKKSRISLPSGYAPLLADLKTRVRAAQVRAVLSVNREMVLLYWNIGREILRCQNDEGWGAKVVERLAKDLRAEFPEIEGFSPRNLKYMRAFAAAYSENEFVQQVVAQIPWGHNLLLLNKLKQPELREWYARKTLEHGWSSKSIGVAQWRTRLVESLPKKLKGSLPSATELSPLPVGEGVGWGVRPSRKLSSSRDSVRR